MKLNEMMEQQKEIHGMQHLEFLLHRPDEFSAPVLTLAGVAEIAVYVRADFSPEMRNNEVDLTEHQAAALERAMELFKWGYSACSNTESWELWF